MNAVYDALTDEEKAELPDDTMTLRHFRAEKGNVKDAISKIKHTLAWRKEFGVYHIVHAFDEDATDPKTLEMRRILTMENETGKIYIRGYDKHGRAIMYMRPARENRMGEEEDNMKHLVYFLERTAAITGRNCGKQKVILMTDYEGFNMKTMPPMSTAKYTLQILQGHYPERMYRAYICHPPFIFRTFWAVIKPFIDPVTKDKVVFVHGQDGLNILERDFGLSKVEDYIGGTKKRKPYDPKEFLYDTPYEYTFDDPAFSKESISERSLPASLSEPQLQVTTQKQTWFGRFGDKEIEILCDILSPY